MAVSRTSHLDGTPSLRKGPQSGGQTSVVVLVNDGLLFDLRVVFFYHYGLVSWFVLVNDSASVVIAIVIMPRADRHSSADRAYADTYTDILCECRSGQCEDRDSSN